MSSYKLITSATVSSAVAQVDLTFIPATYTDLLLYVRARCSGSAAVINFQITFNSNTGTNYDGMLLFSAATGSASAGTQQNFSAIDYNYVGGTSAATFSNLAIYIPSYASSYHKGVSIDGSTNTTNTSTNRNHFTQAIWTNSAAISSINLRADSNNWTVGSQFWLYGIKNT